MALRVELSGGYVVFRYGREAIRGPKVDASMSESQIAAAIRSAAQSVVSGTFNSDKASAFMGLKNSPGKDAKRIYAQLHKAEAKEPSAIKGAVPRPTEKPAEKPARKPALVAPERKQARPVRVPLVPTPKEVERARKLIEQLAGRKLPEPKAKVLKPAEIGRLLQKAIPGLDPKRPPEQAAIETLAKNKDALEAYLATGNNRDNMARLVFRNIIAAMEKKETDFEANIKSLRRGYSWGKSDPNEFTEGQRLALARVFLFDYIAKGNEPYKAEIRPLRSGYADNELARPLDANTLIAAAAYLWRFVANNPKQTLDLGPGALRIQAPASAPVKMPASAPTTQPKPQAPAEKVPIVGVIGDSITAGGYGDTLQKILRINVRAARVRSRGVVGESTDRISRRFARDILGQKPPFNTVIIQAGTNDVYADGKPEAKNTRRILDNAAVNINSMIKRARERGMEVVLLTVTPQKGFELYNEEVAKRINALNKWILSKAGPGVRVVDLSALGEEGRLKREFDTKGHLHPNSKGQDAIARMIAEQAFRDFGRKVPTVLAPEGRANEKAFTLAVKLSELSITAKPAELLKAYRETTAKPAKDTEEALSLSVQRLFNDLKSSDSSFVAFLIMFGTKYDSVRAQGDSLRSDRPDHRVGLATESILSYLNWKANTGKWKVENFEWDVQALNLELGRNPKPGEGTRLPEKRDAYADALLGAAILRWRQANPETAGGGWAKPQKEKKPAQEKGSEWLIR